MPDKKTWHRLNRVFSLAKSVLICVYMLLIIYPHGQFHICMRWQPFSITS
jgi:hypothetical protein